MSAVIDCQDQTIPIEILAGDRRIATWAPDRLLEHFASIGDGCEFGTVQRFTGLEPRELLRFASLPHQGLMRLLDSENARLLAAERFRVFPHARNREWWVGHKDLGIYYHSGRYFADADAETVRQEEQLRLPGLIAQLEILLREPAKILVRFDVDRSEAERDEVYRGLRALGAHSLLWIEPTEETVRIGTVERLKEGLVRGFVAGRSEGASPDPEGFAAWLSIAEQALKILRPDEAAMLAGAAETALPFAGWQDGARAPFLGPALTSTAWEIPPPIPGGVVTRHILADDLSEHSATLVATPVSGFEFESLYVLSALVWVPEYFSGEIGLEFPGTESLVIWHAKPSRFGTWQRIATAIRMPDGMSEHFAGIRVCGSVGAEIFSSDWRLEPGLCPSAPAGV